MILKDRRKDVFMTYGGYRKYVIHTGGIFIFNTKILFEQPSYIFHYWVSVLYSSEADGGGDDGRLLGRHRII